MLGPKSITMIGTIITKAISSSMPMLDYDRIPAPWDYDLELTSSWGTASYSWSWPDAGCNVVFLSSLKKTSMKSKSLHRGKLQKHLQVLMK